MSVVPVLVVEEAISAVGALGTAEQAAGPEPPQESKRKITITSGVRNRTPRNRTPKCFLRRTPTETRQMPMSETPAVGKNIAEIILTRWTVPGRSMSP
jgi:hypothetical protein